MASTQQMNFRIDTDLKKRGDAVFARYGYTPSSAVRRLYELAVRGDDDSIELLDSLFQKSQPDERKREEIQRREQIRQFQEDHVARLKKLGIFHTNVPETSLAGLQEIIAQGTWDNMKEGGIA